MFKNVNIKLRNIVSIPVQNIENCVQLKKKCKCNKDVNVMSEQPLMFCDSNVVKWKLRFIL